MLIQFLEHIKTFTQFEKEDFDRIQDYFDIQMYRKKDVIFQQVLNVIVIIMF